MRAEKRQGMAYSAEKRQGWSLTLPAASLYWKK